MHRRPTALTVFAAVACLPFALHAVEPGDTRAAVVAELGAPTGSAAMGENTILFFARGDVKLRDGRVVTVNLISEAEFAARAAAANIAAQRMEEESQARLARLEAEGRAVHAAKKADPGFAAWPAEAQLEFWRSFAMRYSMISVAAEIAPLVERVDHDLRRRELAAANDARLAEIELRVDSAEDRAARAERRARRVRYGSHGSYGYASAFSYFPHAPLHPTATCDKPPRPIHGHGPSRCETPATPPAAQHGPTSRPLARAHTRGN